MQDEQFEKLSKWGIAAGGAIQDLTVELEIDDAIAPAYVSDLAITLTRVLSGQSLLLYLGDQRTDPPARESLIAICCRCARRALRDSSIPSTLKRNIGKSERITLVVSVRGQRCAGSGSTHTER